MSHPLSQMDLVYTKLHPPPVREKQVARTRLLEKDELTRFLWVEREWAADPNRRNDIYDASTKAPVSTSRTITGSAGAAGCVEGRVRLLDALEQGEQLQREEILVAVTTNVGWTPLFPRGAIVTDVGAPLSCRHCRRELGIPAVVGCGSATTRLHTGDRVSVDGGRGTVEILENGRFFET